MNRRSLLAGMAAVSISGFPNVSGQFRSPEQEEYPPLKSLTARCGGLVGTQAGFSVLRQNTPLTQFIATNMSILTPGNDLKWASVHPAQDEYSFSDPDGVMAFCASHGIAVHGHNLCWQEQNPAWVKGTVNSSNGEQILRDHIRTVAGRYRGKIDSWDVVNEPIAVWQGRPDGLRTGPWTDALGAAYIDIAFHAAAEADPTAIRVLNLNHVEQTEKQIEAFRAKTLELISGMLARKVPVQAIGLESHLDTSRPLDLDAVIGFVRQIKRMGLAVMITEMDILDSTGPAEFSGRDALVAQYYDQYLSALLPVAAPRRIIFWSLSDYGNWYDHLPSMKRPDQQLHRPGLFDAQMISKPALDVVVRNLQKSCAAAPRR